MITAREYSFQKTQKQFTIEMNTTNIKEIEKEFKKIAKKFKNYTNFDKIHMKIDINYHENDEYLFYKGL